MPRSVLIAPLLGYGPEKEWQRLRQTLDECGAARVHLLTRDPAEERKPETRDFVVARLEELARASSRFEWREHHADLFSFTGCLEVMARIFAEERGNPVAVSLATAGAPGAIAGTVACILWGAEGIYVSDKRYGSAPVETLPGWLYRGSPLTDHQLRVLKLVVEHEDGLDLKGILDGLREAGSLREDQEEKHAYRRLGTHLLPPLEDHGFVTVGPRDDFDRRHKFVRATEEGRRAYQVFAPMLREPKATLHVRGPRKPAAPRAERL